MDFLLLVERQQKTFFPYVYLKIYLKIQKKLNKFFVTK